MTFIPASFVLSSKEVRGLPYQYSFVKLFAGNLISDFFFNSTVIKLL